MQQSASLWNLTLFDRIKIDGAFDYYLIALLTQQLDSAFSGELALSVKVYQLNNFNIYAGISSRAFFLKEAGMYETNINGKVGIGISYNE